ncbi:hypothetical protein [Desulfovermiculus halophilus]|jgi:hypothetical protein|uniref:hypothetical protein n=1 Tax=Desulfovermiculus halophilus TaxID=339722 RepID=UPI0004808F77|nr:hypothetical protein [Desulfovermiculus halophilus]
MHTSPISLRQLSKVRTRPLNVHCRSLLEEAGQVVNQGTIGAPELMLWTLQTKKSDLGQDDSHHLQEIVHMIQDKPSLVLSILEPSGDQEENNELLPEVQAQDAPEKAGLVLLRYLKQRMDNIVGR